MSMDHSEMTNVPLQHQADTEKGFQVREQVCKAPKEGETIFHSTTLSFPTIGPFFILFSLFPCFSIHPVYESGCGVQLPKPVEDCQEEGVLHGRRRGRRGQSL